MLIGSSSLCFLTIGSHAAVLPRFVRDEIAGGAASIGVVMGVTAAIALLLRPFAGSLSDRIGRRTPAVVGGLVMAAGCALLAPAGSLATVIAGRVLLGAGEAVLTVAAMAWLIDAIPEQRRGRALGAYGMSIWFGLALGPQWSVAVLDEWGYPAVWEVGAAMVLIAGLMPLLLVEPRRVRPAETPPGPSASAGAGWWASVPRGALLPGLVFVLAAYGHAVLESFGVLHLSGRGLSPGGGIGGAASVFTVIAVATFGGRMAGGWLCDRFGPWPVAAAAVLPLIGCYVIFAFAASFAVAVVAAVLCGAGLALLYPSLAMIVADAVPAHQRGAGLGIYIGAMDVAFGAGALIGGLVVAGASSQVALLSGAGVALTAFLPLLVIGRRLGVGPGARLARAEASE